MISVLICTRNRAEALHVTLADLFVKGNVDEPRWEVLVVDNDSNDETKTVCEDFEKRYPRIFRRIVEQRRGLSHARNRGITHSHGNIIAWLDDDASVTPQYVASIRETFGTNDVDGVQGRILLDCEGGRPDWLGTAPSQFLCLRDYGENCFEWNDNLAGVNMLMRASVFHELGGFSPQLGAGTAVGFAEDSEFTVRMRRAGKKMIYAPQIMVRHRLPMGRITPVSIRKRFFLCGRSNAYFHEKTLPEWRLIPYTAKEFVLNELRAMQQRMKKRPDKSLDLQCRSQLDAGFCYQHLLFTLGHPRTLGFPRIDRLKPEENGERARAASGSSSK